MVMAARTVYRQAEKSLTDRGRDFGSTSSRLTSGIDVSSHQMFRARTRDPVAISASVLPGYISSPAICS